MEQTALRPKPMPGRECGGDTPPDPVRRPHAARRRGRRLTTLLLGCLAATVLVLSGVGLGTMGATVIGMSRLAEAQRQADRPTAAARRDVPAPAAPAPSPAPARVSLGVEAVDAGRPGAMVVGVHVPGPGFSAGLVRGDVLLTFGGTRIDSADDLARAVAGAHPGTAVTLTVRRSGGGYQRLTATPGVVT
ncbi:PDZ domain-containing protein [Streptomyces sp. NPDC005574]|uniref:PDZ domain-containing protein n=1 Tax=Streptomyces sp. NPDC005574 TaxID=3156891 RepID=UPI0033BF4B56